MSDEVPEYDPEDGAGDRELYLIDPKWKDIRDLEDKGEADVATTEPYNES